jgi:fumarylacetoacetase
MTPTLDRTHDAALQSWMDSANDPATDFPLQNLPLGMFRRAGGGDPAVGPGVAIGDRVADLRAAVRAGLLPQELADAIDAVDVHGGWNPFLARGKALRQALREALSDALRAGAPRQADWRATLVPQADAEFALPCRVGDYTDFYAGIHHATTIGSFFRPDNPLLPNYKWVPIGYHGRASSLGPSGQRFPRPNGQTRGPDDAAPAFGPCKRLDYELEVGAFVAGGNPQGRPVPLAEAEDHLAGLVLLNDWSARDIQAWEYQPLGPFLSKSFASTLSPWLITPEALAPFRAPWTRAAGDPQPLPYLEHPSNRAAGAFDIALEVLIQTEAMRAAGQPHQRLTRSNFRDAYWTFAQMLAHHSSNGCNLQPGDLFGSGTMSAEDPSQGGSLLEQSRNGKEPITLANGERRTFLQDGDSIVLRGRCDREGFRAIGFGDCEGRVLPAVG